MTTDTRLDYYHKQEILMLWQIIELWETPPDHVKKLMRDLRILRNEINRLENGEVK